MVVIASLRRIAAENTRLSIKIWVRRDGDQYSEKSVAGAAAHVRAARDRSISRREALSAAAMAGADRADARSRRRRALRGLLPVFGRLPRGLHRAAGDRG